ncbi:MAG: hypothetical protein IPJ76_03770 [Flavobacteriales bacterium]|nr:MAG: hypothetical protein IPJ76_03770 [Flavobacteriales bacterium]
MRFPSLIVLGLLAFAPALLLAQGPKKTVLFGRCTTTISQGQEKQLQMLLNSTDPLGLLSVHTNRHHVKVLHSTDLAQGAVASIFQLVGLDLEVFQSAPGTTANRAPDSTKAPVFVDTGNPDLDAQNYAAAKAAWAETYPHQYEEFFGQ